MRKLILLGIFFMVLLSVKAMAVPPVSTAFDNLEGFNLETPTINYWKTNTDIRLAVHVFNASNGVKLFNSSGISCRVRVGNQTGVKIADSGEISNMVDGWPFTVAANNFTTPGIYNYLWTCNSTTQGGWYQGYFEISDVSYDQNFSNYSLIFIGCIFLFLFILCTAAIIYFEKPWIKVILFLLDTVLLMSLTRLSAWFLEITNPNQTGLIQFINHWYNYSIWSFRITLVLSIIFLVLYSIRMMDYRRKDGAKPKWSDYDL